MLGLLAPTDPRWVEAVEGDLGTLLADHAHCELKAAQNALSLVGRFGGQMPELVAPLTALAREEIEHFAAVHDRLAARGMTLPLPASDHYVKALQKSARDREEDSPILLDRLLIAALIEGRSCERFRLLSEHLANLELRAFYRELMASEARHHRLFAGLAEKQFGVDHARRRLRELAEQEAEVVELLSLGPTVHG